MKRQSMYCNDVINSTRARVCVCVYVCGRATTIAFARRNVQKALGPSLRRSFDSDCFAAAAARTHNLKTYYVVTQQ